MVTGATAVLCMDYEEVGKMAFLGLIIGVTGDRITLAFPLINPGLDVLSRTIKDICSKA